MSSARDFFSDEEQQQIIRAIQQAEDQTSGEIRVHLEDKLNGNILDRAATVFRQLKMDRTELRNGVLIYVVPNEKQFAIIGDAGIHEKVTDNFWNTVKDEMQLEFQNGQTLNAILTGIKRTSEELKVFFPLKQDDKNELSDELSF